MNFTEAYIKELCLQHFQIHVEAKALNGYDELNFLLKDKIGQQYILKVATDEHGYHFLDAQVKIVNHLSKSEVSGKFQHYLLNTAGKELTILVIEGKNYYLRILSFVKGIFWVDANEKTDALHIDLGNLLGRMDKALQNFSHPAMHRHYTWDVSTAMDANAKIKYITNHERRRMAGYFLLQFEMEVLPVLSSLRHAYAHNDANDYNLLVQGDVVSGLIDFGDMVYTALINNVAVACTYAMLNNNHPLHTASLVVKSYHAVYPLTSEELDILYYLIAARLCISVTQSAYNASQDSSNEHHFITEKPAWDLMYQLIRINPIKAQDAFRKACGFEGVIHETDYADLLQQRKEHVGRNLSISYKEKLKIVKSALQYLYDDKGRTFIDCVNNPSHVGHCHPSSGAMRALP